MSEDDFPLNLNNLPTEILLIITTMLPLPHLKHLSCVNKRFRNTCLPILFRQITLGFSEIGERDLRWILSSDVRHCVKSFTYVVPDLLSPRILHFDTFQYSIFPPREYAERIREKYGEDYEAAAAFPSYMAIYYSIRTICEEQHLIKDNRDDLALLSSVFAALPRLKEVSLRCVEMADWVEESQLFLSTITNDNSYNHHFQVIAAALRAARDRCSYIETLEISGLHLPYYYGYRGLLRQITVKELLDGITTLRVHQCNESFLRLLSNCVHDISQLDLCCLCLDEDGLGIFRHLFQANWKSLRCIGFHDVTWYRPFGSERKKLTPDLLCNMLEAETQTGLWKRDDCSCLATRRDPEDVEGSWRLELGDSDGVPKLVLPLKRKFEDMAPY